MRKRGAVIAIGILTSVNLFAAGLARRDPNFLEAAAHAGHSEIEAASWLKPSLRTVKSGHSRLMQDFSVFDFGVCLRGMRTVKIVPPSRDDSTSMLPP